MAESQIQSNENDDKLAYIGDLVTKIETILSPKPINVWHLPGALQRTLSSVLLIIRHGCEEDFEGYSKLWNFISGLRVVRPDLWPTFELKSRRGNLSNDQLVCQWLEVSLQSHLLSSQLKTLLEDRKRLHSYYDPNAFLRCRKYTDALLIALQSLELNSQDILATLNPCLMVKFYMKKKKENPGKEITFSIPESSDKYENKIYPCNPSECKTSTETPLCSKNNSCQNLTLSEDVVSTLSSSKVSPSFLKVDYCNSMLSDGDKSISPTQIPLNYETTTEEDNSNLFRSSVIEKRISGVNSSNHNDDVVKTQMLQERSLIAEAETDKSRCLGNAEHQILVEEDFLIEQSEVVKPSPFLIEYLKSKFSSPDQISILKETSADKLEEHSAPDLSLSSINLQGESNNNVEATNIAASGFLHRNSSPSLLDCKPSFETSKKSEGNVSSSKLGSTKKRSHIRSHSDGVRRIVREPPLGATSFSSAAKSSQPPNKALSRKRFMEDGGQSITPEADGFFPHPQPGQNLLDFFTSAQFSKTSAQLDRENAHFNIAEAVLAAIEQMNFETCHFNGRKPPPTIQYESEEDVSVDKNVPSNRRRLRHRSRIPFSTETSDDDPATTDYSVFDSPEPESSEVSEAETCSSEVKVEDMEVNSDDEGESLCSTTDPSNAENVAIAILRHYNSRLLPKASELQWLVSEQEAPQKLLPMPNSVAVSPDDAEGGTFQPLLRGTSDWAPPRPQLILTLHKNTKRKARLVGQKWRCAGCGLSVSEKLSRHFRLCHYLGRYFCTNCHTDKKAIVPAKVLHEWDFKKYAICNFSFELLSRMSADPLFHLGTLNPRLYKQSRELHQTLLYRLQLSHARGYIYTCNRAHKERALLEDFPFHWSTEPNVYSLDDFLSVKKKQIAHQVKSLTTACVKHISNCQICLGQGFICEICREGNPIFPFQLDAVTQCGKCKECFHLLCFSPNNSCPRCDRRERRDGTKGGT